jgi:hypothetical protein
MSAARRRPDEEVERARVIGRTCSATGWGKSVRLNTGAVKGREGRRRAPNANGLNPYKPHPEEAR